MSNGHVLVLGISLVQLPIGHQSGNKLTSDNNLTFPYAKEAYAAFEAANIAAIEAKAAKMAAFKASMRKRVPKCDLVDKIPSEE